ncbi:alpha/beta hydrolase [soil metagenome]
MTTSIIEIIEADEPTTMNPNSREQPSRRQILIGRAAIAATFATPAVANAVQAGATSKPLHARTVGGPVDTITVKDGTRIYFKDWGTGQPIFFHHGWPLSADDWDAQMMFFLDHGYRVIAHDRRGHGRSTQTANGNDMDTYAADVDELVTALKLSNVIHVGHSTGGGEVIRYVARHGKGRVSKAVLISAIPPAMLKSERNPNGIPIEVIDGIRKSVATNRAQFYEDFTMAFYGFNRPRVTTVQGVRDNWWRQAMMGGIKAEYDCIKAWSESTFYEDIALVEVPVLVMHSEDDQLAPFATTGKVAAQLLKHGTLKSYPNFPHGMPTTQAEQINADMLAFLKL